MTRLAVIAAGGESRRTGLGDYTTKAALLLHGRSLLAYQIDFARGKFRADRVLVVCRSRHARLLGERLTPGERAGTAFVLYDGEPIGWAGTIEQAMPHVMPEDEVLLISCDNLHTAPEVHALGDRPALFTYTRWDRADRGPTDGPILVRARTVWGEGEDVWVPRSGAGYVGDLFTGYAVARGAVLREALTGIVPEDGKKEFTALLAVLSRFPGCRALPYGGTYEDVADLAALARLGAGRRAGDETARVTIGAGVLLHDGRGRVFLTERQDGRGWVPPGGLVDVGETYAHAAARELCEEAGIQVAEVDLWLLGVYPTVGKEGELAVSVMFRTRFGKEGLANAGSVESVTSGAEVRRFGWFSLDESRALVIPFDLRDAVEDHFAGRLDTR